MSLNRRSAIVGSCGRPGLAPIALWVLIVGLGGPLAAQEDGPEVEPRVYPYAVVPVDAIVGHLMEGFFSEPVGVHFDARHDELLVVDSKNALIGIFDPRGLPAFSFGGRSVLSDPRAVFVTGDDTILVLDGDRSALKSFSYRGEPMGQRTFEYPEWQAEPEGTARIGAFTIDRHGATFVGDLDRPQVLVYEPDGTFRRALRASTDGAFFQQITGLAVSAAGLLAVTDFKATPVQIFDASGRRLVAFGRRDIGRDSFTAPADVAFDEEGFVYIADMLRHEVKIFDTDGHFVGQFGGWYSARSGGRAPGEMQYPSGVAIAPGGLIYVAERFGQRVQVFRRVRLEELAQAAAPAAPDDG